MSTVLLIEDDGWLADLYRDILQSGGHRVIAVSDAQTGVGQFDEHPIDVVVLDLMLPDANGIQLLHEMRTYPDLAGIPVIINSAVDPADSGLDMDVWKAYGVVGYVVKGDARPQELLRAVNHVVAATA
jgi:DNA-binding response OmpR family regulator